MDIRIMDSTTVIILGTILGTIHIGTVGTDRGVTVGIVGIRLGTTHGVMVAIMDMDITTADRIMEDIIPTIKIILTDAIAEIAFLPDAHLSEPAAIVHLLVTTIREEILHLVLL